MKGTQISIDKREYDDSTRGKWAGGDLAASVQKVLTTNCQNFECNIMANVADKAKDLATLVARSQAVAMHMLKDKEVTAVATFKLWHTCIPPEEEVSKERIANVAKVLGVEIAVLVQANQEILQTYPTR